MAGQIYNPPKHQYSWGRSLGSPYFSIENSMKSVLFLALLVTVLLQVVDGAEPAREQVSIKTRNPRVTLEGTLTRPAGAATPPVLIFVWGNGPHTRDQTISGTPMFRILAESLALKGFATLRVDKPLSGATVASKGTSEDSITTFDLADDIQSCYDYLQGRSDIDRARVGLLGHSEGALIGSILASRIPSIKWLILLAPPAATCKDIVLLQRRENAEELHMPASEIDSLAYVWNRLIDTIVNDRTNDSAYYALGRDFLRVQGADKSQMTNQFINQLLSDFRTPWYSAFLAIDPATYLAKISCPVLCLLGSRDDQVSANQNVLPLNNALQRAPTKDYTVALLSNHDHFFLLHRGEYLAEHKFGEMEFSQRALDEIEGWLNARRE
jgi:pimeloyl-ACP methyl ester carboxylesterase